MEHKAIITGAGFPYHMLAHPAYPNTPHRGRAYDDTSESRQARLAAPCSASQTPPASTGELGTFFCCILGNLRLLGQGSLHHGERAGQVDGFPSGILHGHRIQVVLPIGQLHDAACRVAHLQAQQPASFSSVSLIL